MWLLYVSVIAHLLLNVREIKFLASSGFLRDSIVCKISDKNIKINQMQLYVLISHGMSKTITLLKASNLTMIY